MTVVELKLAIANLPDDTPIRLSYQRNVMEVYESKNSTDAEYLLALELERSRGFD